VTAPGRRPAAPGLSQQRPQALAVVAATTRRPGPAVRGWPPRRPPARRGGPSIALFSPPIYPSLVSRPRFSLAVARSLRWFCRAPSGLCWQSWSSLFRTVCLSSLCANQSRAAAAFVAATFLPFPGERWTNDEWSPRPLPAGRVQSVPSVAPGMHGARGQTRREAKALLRTRPPVALLSSVLRRRTDDAWMDTCEDPR
jgi:hypothetical protein